MARPTLLTKGLIALAEKAVARSWCLETAAQMLGIDRRTLARWLREGNRERRRRERGAVDASKDLHVRFAVAVERALANQVGDFLDLIRRAAEAGDWRAAAWILERRRPEEFGLRESRELVRLGNQVDELGKLLRESFNRQNRQDYRSSTFDFVAGHGSYFAVTATRASSAASSDLQHSVTSEVAQSFGRNGAAFLPRSVAA